MRVAGFPSSPLQVNASYVLGVPSAVFITWSAPSNTGLGPGNNNVPISQYTLSGSVSSTTVPSCWYQGLNTSVSCAGLIAGQLYTFVVVAYNVAGASTPAGVNKTALGNQCPTPNLAGFRPCRGAHLPDPRPLHFQVRLRKSDSIGRHPAHPCLPRLFPSLLRPVLDCMYSYCADGRCSLLCPCYAVGIWPTVLAVGVAYSTPALGCNDSLLCIVVQSMA